MNKTLSSSTNNQLEMRWKKRFTFSIIISAALIVAMTSIFTYRTISIQNNIVSDSDIKFLDHSKYFALTWFWNSYTKNSDPTIHPVDLLGYGIGENGELWMKFSTIKLIDPDDWTVYSKWKNVSVHLWPREGWPQEPGNLGLSFDYEDVEDMDVIIDEKELYKDQL